MMDNAVKCDCAIAADIFTECFQMVEKPGDFSELIMTFIGVIERNAESIDSSVPEFELFFFRQPGRIGNENNIRNTTRLL